MSSLSDQRAADIRSFVHENPFQYTLVELADMFSSDKEEVEAALRDHDIPGMPAVWEPAGDNRNVWGFSADLGSTQAKRSQDHRYLLRRFGAANGHIYNLYRWLLADDVLYGPGADPQVQEMREVLEKMYALLPPETQAKKRKSGPSTVADEGEELL